MEQNKLVEFLTGKIQYLDEENLMKVSDYVDFLEYRKKINSAIDKQTLLDLISSKGYEDLYSFAKELYETNLPRGPVGGYTRRGRVINWIKFQLDCTVLQAEEILIMLYKNGYVEFSFHNNVYVVEEKFKN
jgi:hypothetical protein